MKAVQMSRFGGPEVLELVEVLTPVPRRGEVLVRVHAAGVNFAETLMRQNLYAVTPELPFIPGSEVAGIVVGIGSDVDGIALGERVVAPLFAAGRFHGGYAEYAVIDSAYVAPLPEDVSFAAAMALTVQGLTALHLLRRTEPKGRTVLVSAAAGGVGLLLVQLAKRAGARIVVAAAGSQAKLALACSRGADFGVDYTREGWDTQVRVGLDGAGPEIIYESVGGSVTPICLTLLAPTGRLVIYGALNIQDFRLGVPELLGLVFKNQSITGFAVAPLLTPEVLQERLLELFGLAAGGAIDVKVATFPLSGAAEAHRALESRATTGKVVLEP
jgi:NADPH2:quinone reductase